MPIQGEYSGGLDFIHSFNKLVSDAHEDLTIAEILEAKASQLRREAPVKLNSALTGATKKLFALDRKGSLTSRETYEAAITIHNVISGQSGWSTHFNTVESMKWFDAFQPYEPFVSKTARGNRVNAFVTDLAPLQVSLQDNSVLQVPEAHVHIPVFRAYAGDSSYSTHRYATTVSVVMPRNQESIAIGQESIQTLIDNQTLYPQQRNRIFDLSTQFAYVHSLAQAAHALLSLGYDLDTQHIDKHIEKITDYEQKFGEIPHYY